MDNNMTAVVSAVMIALGFVQGFMIAQLFAAQEIGKMRRLLNEAVDLQLESDQRIDELETELELEKLQKDQLVEQMRRVIIPHTRLPPPEGPLERSQACSDSDSECEFKCPCSPEPNPGSKE